MLRKPNPLPACSLAILAVCASQVSAQPQPVRDAAALQVMLDKLQVLGTVLYVAAHPDDENTASLACFSQGAKARTAYLSMTRGGGGQNLIGHELGDGLAAIRTQELLAARRLDGAEQYFTRCVDFGFSKTPEETLAIWGHDAALADVVWTIRKLRPDVIITRFSPTLRGTHGHHTASAILALEAFKAAADPRAFPEQLKAVRPWQARRILWNSYRPQAERDAMKPGDYLTQDVGRYEALLGKSFTELAAESRSMHRSQGFGAVASRGARLEYFELLAGAPGADLFEGVDLTWGRVRGGEAVGTLLAQARAAYRPEQPAPALALLLKAKAALEAMPPDPWVDHKRLDLVEAIRCAAGLWPEALAERPAAAPGEKVAVTATLIARGSGGVTLKGVTVAGTPAPAGEQLLQANTPFTATAALAVPAGAAPTQPCWLDPSVVPPSPLAGLPEGPAAFRATFRLEAQGVPFELTVPVQYRYRDPVLGERYQPFVVTPAVLVNLPDPVQILGDDAPRALTLNLAAGGGPAAGTLRLAPPPGWKAEPAAIPFALKAGEERKVNATLTPPPRPGTGTLELSVEVGGAVLPAQGRVRIDYPHIPLQTLFPAARVKLVRLDLKRDGRKIGYVMGSGDDLPRMLRPLGYDVDLLTDEDLAGGRLADYDAIVVGIRAFNTRPRLAQLKDRLLDYVAGGGTEVVLYTVDQGMVTADLGPFPFKVSRDRVTEETAAVTFLAKDHPALNWPNRITQADFDGWVQERGLYYARDWDPRYTAVLASADAGEQPLAGGLIVAPHGKGHFVYTGLAFFRQLPEGVPGAYRLFANLLALKDAP